ncbi:hypothetical protein [Rhizobium sp. N122]|uniref:hypothetical protein n=1 Tax=Rhizobium sp. N122 TaxID=1764272 RepID=UPI00167ED6E5|nr:hypothetical protein [Rhizobium sp. N122]
MNSATGAIGARFSWQRLLALQQFNSTHRRKAFTNIVYPAAAASQTSGNKTVHGLIHLIRDDFFHV